jgi:protein-tyrosine kinase
MATRLIQAVAESPTAEARATVQRIVPPADSKLLAGPGLDPVALEQYRRLAALLHQSQVQNQLRSVIVASAVPGEGKTLTSINLALTLSGSFRRRVVLVDADLRRPTVHDVLRIPNVTGLNEGLKADGNWNPPLIEIGEHLSVLTAGRPNPDPMSALTSHRMRQLIQDLREQFEWVIIDTAPVGLLSDAHLLSDMVDGAVLVIAAGRAPYRLVEQAVESLGRDRLLGVVLNRIQPAMMSQAYGYGAYKYYGERRGKD